MKKPLNLWPEIWGILGCVAVVSSVFLTVDKGQFLFIVGLLAMLRGDGLGIRREMVGWTKL